MTVSPRLWLLLVWFAVAGALWWAWDELVFVVRAVAEVAG